MHGCTIDTTQGHYVPQLEGMISILNEKHAKSDSTDVSTTSTTSSYQTPVELSLDTVHRLAQTYLQGASRRNAS